MNKISFRKEVNDLRMQLNVGILAPYDIAVVVVIHDDPLLPLRDDLLESLPVLRGLQVISGAVDEKHVNILQALLQVFYGYKGRRSLSVVQLIQIGTAIVKLLELAREPHLVESI
jgi:hypothetical protein